MGARIKVVVEGALVDGHNLSFKAPCSCSGIEGLLVQYVENLETKNKFFELKDAHGNNVAGIGNLFDKDAIVKVILDTVNNAAYIQNADTNAYLEGRFATIPVVKTKTATGTTDQYGLIDLRDLFGINNTSWVINCVPVDVAYHAVLADYTVRVFNVTYSGGVQTFSRVENTAVELRLAYI